MKVVIIGVGQMGEAIVSQLAEYSVVGIEQEQSSCDRLNQKYPFAKFMTQEVIDVDDAYVIVAVKPQSFSSLQTKGCAKGVISIMAGVTLAKIAQGINAKAYCRAMPNVAALYGASMTTVTGDEGLKEIALSLLSTIGQSVWLKSEKELDIATALTGSGPAYMMLVAEALADGAVAQGLSRNDALKLTQGLFEGSAALLKGDHPAVIKDRVMSPGGTTAAGYGALEAKSVRSAFMDAIKAAYCRAQELS